MSRLNLYLIKGILKNGDTLSRSIIQSKLSGTENKFRVLHYIVTAKSTDDALQIQIPYSRIGSDWDSEYFLAGNVFVCVNFQKFQKEIGLHLEVMAMSLFTEMSLNQLDIIHWKNHIKSPTS